MKWTQKKRNNQTGNSKIVNNLYLKKSTQMWIFLLYYINMQKSLFFKLGVVFLLLSASLGGFVVVAHAEPGCPEIFTGLTEIELRAALVSCEKEASALQEVIAKTGKEKATLSNDITGLNAKIKQAKLAINMRTLSINSLAYDIKIKSSDITKLSAKIDRQRDSLAQLIRKTDEIYAYSFAEVALSDKKISEFFGDLDSFEYLEEAIGVSLMEIDVTKKTTEEQKGILEVKKTKESDLRYKQELEKKRTEANEAEKQRILKVTKGKEVVYQKDLKEKQKKASQIRAALFKLRDTEGIPFGKALEYANIASKGTNVRSALILAILTQESDLGKNVGSCLLSSVETGDGVGKNSGTVFEQVMKSPRDTSPFQDITNRLGLDWKTTPISCPPGTKYFSGRGFGGGMGPAQFIPSTWELFKSRIARIVGGSASNANPWNPAHAFTATAIYLADLGADNGGYTAERNASCRYYSGRKCDNARPVNTFYGNEVLKKAEVIQSNIDFLNGG